ncbi:MAG: 23S rRNA (pseudouridine(1915)-N(3))-methyltransferase RlmH [Thiotrichales bacterium]
MQIHLIAVGQKMPGWVSQGYEEYARRMPPDCRLNLIELPAGQRRKNADIDRILQQEAERMLDAIPKGAFVIALDVDGKPWDTAQLSTQMGQWMQGGSDIALLVGGPEGLHSKALARAQQRWSLSPLTFPHPLVRVIVAEQLYRALSLLRNHPYHRE